MREERVPEDDFRLEGVTLERLIELQRSDRRIMEAEQGLVRRPKEVVTRREKIDAQARVAKDAKDVVVSAKKRIDALGVESQALRNDMLKLEGQLFSLKSNDEFNAMKAQIKARGQKNDEIQNQTLELMMALEELDVAAKREEATLQEMKRDFAAFEAKIAAENAVAAGEVEGMRSARDASAAALPGHLRDLYESVRARRDGIGLVRVEEEICKGCDTQITMQLLARVAARRLIQCPNCDRILWV